MDFKKWLETAVIDRGKTTSDIGTPPEPPFNDEGDDDDDEWSWEKVHAKFGAVVQKWVDEDPFAKKIKGKILEVFFSTEPQMEDQFWSYDQNSPYGEHILPEGEGEVKVTWTMNLESMEQRFQNTIRDANKCLLWKYMGLPVEQWYATLDKGDFGWYVWAILITSLSDFNYGLATAETGNKFSNAYFQQKQDWGRDKININKYAMFTGESMRDRIEAYIKDSVHDQWIMQARNMPQPKNIEVQIVGMRPNGRAMPSQEKMECQLSCNFQYRITQ